MNNTVKIFLKLVQIDSPSGHEAQVSLFIQNWLKRNMFEFKIDETGNIYATNNKPGNPLLLCAHMDTVQPGVGIKPKIKDGIITGSGDTILGADNKAALAAILTAIEETNPKRNLELLFTVKEETGGGVEFFPFEWIKAKQGVIFDKSNPLGGIVLASPHICNFHIVLNGKAAHSGTPQNGINAFVPAFNLLSGITVGKQDNEQTTINIGLIKGGQGINTIPDNLTISGEVRSYDKVLFLSHLANIKSLFETETKKFQVSFDFLTDGFCDGYSFLKTDGFIKKIAGVYSTAGLKICYYDRSGISDANILNKHSIQTVNLTDGAKYPHTKEEQIGVDDLHKLMGIVTKCIVEL